MASVSWVFQNKKCEMNKRVAEQMDKEIPCHKSNKEIIHLTGGGTRHVGMKSDFRSLSEKWAFYHPSFKTIFCQEKISLVATKTKAKLKYSKKNFHRVPFSHPCLSWMHLEYIQSKNEMSLNPTMLEIMSADIRRIDQGVKIPSIVGCNDGTVIICLL